MVTMILPPMRFRSEQGQLEPATLLNAVLINDPEIASATIFDQAARYNLVLKVPFLIITNGFEMHIAKVNFETQTTELLKEFPFFL